MSKFTDARAEATRILNEFSTAMYGKKRDIIEPRSIQLRPDDIVITPYPKAGTTLMQNMLYQIAVATGGAPSSDPDGTNFTDITKACPWIDYGTEFGYSESFTHPRIFKSHGLAKQFNFDQAKYIYVVRNPLDYPASWLDFMSNSPIFSQAKTSEVRSELVQEVFRRRILAVPCDFEDRIREKFGFKLPYWLDHVSGWLREAERSNVLILFYEDILKDMRSTILRVATFMDRSISEDAVETVMARCDREAMAGDPKFRCGVEAQSFGMAEAWKVLPKDRKGYKEYSIDPILIDQLKKKLHESFEVSDYEQLRKRYSNQK